MNMVHSLVPKVCSMVTCHKGTSDTCEKRKSKWHGSGGTDRWLGFKTSRAIEWVHHCACLLLVSIWLKCAHSNFLIIEVLSCHVIVLQILMSVQSMLISVRTMPSVQTLREAFSVLYWTVVKATKWLQVVTVKVRTFFSSRRLEHTDWNVKQYKPALLRATTILKWCHCKP